MWMSSGVPSPCCSSLAITCFISRVARLKIVYAYWICSMCDSTSSFLFIYLVYFYLFIYFFQVYLWLFQILISSWKY
jgi:hypothetical protein